MVLLRMHIKRDNDGQWDAASGSGSGQMLFLAASLIALTCTGRTYDEVAGRPGNFLTATVTIDLDNKIVDGVDIGCWATPRCRVTSVTDQTISFREDQSVPGSPTAYTEGILDRYTGSMEVEIVQREAGGDRTYMSYSLTCKPAKQLF
jgi:hypothetical protein